MSFLETAKRKGKKRRSWPTWYALVENVPVDSGVYFVWKGEEVLYIGGSTNLRQRLWSHEQRAWFVQHGITHVTYKIVSLRLLDLVEVAAILHHKPRFNRRHMRRLMQYDPASGEVSVCGSRKCQ